MLESSVTVLIITAILGLLGIGIIIAAVFFSQNKEANSGGITGTTGMTGSTGPTGICVGPGIEPSVPAPSYTRISPVTTCSTPLATDGPPFPSISHSVQPNYRIRSLSYPISPNHWIANAAYGSTNQFLLYPYYARIEDDGLEISWPGTEVLSATCNSSSTSTCPSGGADLSYDVAPGATIKIGNRTQNSLACDIVDVDPLVVNVIWQYQDYNSTAAPISKIGIPLAKGCPYITMETTQSPLTLECAADFVILDPTTNTSVSSTDAPGTSLGPSDQYQLTIGATGSIPGATYVMFLNRPRPIQIYPTVIYFPIFTGVLRLAYFDSEELLQLLTQNYTVYPIESTIGVTGMSNDTVYDVDTTFSWTTATMDSSGDANLMMLALLNHNIVNTQSEGSLMSHPVLGRYRPVVTTNDEWILADSVPVYPVTYPVVGTTGDRELLKQTWLQEIPNLSSPPSEIANWCRWIGSIAMMVQIGTMLISNGATGMDTELSTLQEVLMSELSAISQNSAWAYDSTWNGILSRQGLEDCTGLSDGGNAFYFNHIDSYGYVLFAFAVGCSLDGKFLTQNQSMILSFLRTTVNPCGNDSSYPLWRNKDWYYGYSIGSGLSPNQSRGKKSSDGGEAVLGYYGAYLLSTIIPNNSNLTAWTAALLASEIIAQQYDFIFTSQGAITVNSNFVQGTITDRFETGYEYTVVGGNTYFPMRNASMMVVPTKPFTLMSYDYLSPTWLNFVYPWMASAVQTGIDTMDSESILTAVSLLGFQNTPPFTRSTLLNILNAQSTCILPYGSTWSAGMYWILSLS